MRHWATLWIVFTLSMVALSGCAGKGGGGTSSEPSVSDAEANKYDRAIGNDGFRVTGSLTGSSASLGADSAVQIDIVDNAPSDGAAPQDKASLILDVKETGLNVQATLRSMASGSDALSTADHYGGAGHNVKVFGTSGVGPQELPETTAYLFAVGLANLKVGDEVQPKRLVYLAVTQGLRDASGAALTSPDPANLQVHVIFPGKTVENLAPVDGVPDGFLYYYFESVGLSKLSGEDRGKVGSDLAPPEKVNVPPVADGKILVDGAPATGATMVGNKSASVTFDASASSDDTGVIRWVWRVFELNNNGTYEKPAETAAVVQGQKVGYNFTKPGPKLVNLTVSDAQGALDTMVLTLYINHNTLYPGGGSIHTQFPSGGPACNPPVNCFSHISTIYSGFVEGVYTVKPNGSSMNGVNIEVYAPGKDNVGVDTPVHKVQAMSLTLTEAHTKNLTGRYKVVVWWQAASNTGFGPDNNKDTLDGPYNLEAKISYTPKV